MSSKISLKRIKKYFIHLLKHRRIEFTYAIIVIILTGMAIYSAYSVIYDFINDNTMTSVKINTTDNILPFVQYFSVYYYFYPIYPGRCKYSLVHRKKTLN